MEKKIMLTGLQPTGTITLGNYIGAIKQMVDYQEKYQSIIFIADMHAITVPIDSEVLAQNIRQLIALYIACGVNPEKNMIFLQSDNEYHANIAWMLECNTYFGELSRMTQFKDKKQKQVEGVSTALLTYPVLMAGDILLYNADCVPVGADQKQHLELTRNLAIRFNSKYSDTFKVPEPLIQKTGAKIMSLQEPTKKMSKSDSIEKASIFILDEPNIIRKKIASAVTDCDGVIKYDPENKPGISKTSDENYSKYSTNSEHDGINTVSINGDSGTCNTSSCTFYVAFTKEGMRKGVLTISDRAGNKVQYTISANLDRTSPAKPTVSYKKSSNNNNYNPGAWSNSDIVSHVKGASSDALAGWSRYEYSYKKENRC